MCETNIIYNEDCMETMQRIPKESVDLVLTSPPYNTNMKAKGGETTLNGNAGDYHVRYDKFTDVMPNKEYRAFTTQLFKEYDKILKKNGVVLYNISYGNENSECMFLSISDIIAKTDFTVGDVITWKKKCALPANVSPNKLTRITEFVFVFCRKEEYKTYHANKQVVSRRSNGQKMYGPIYNYIEAANNDGKNPFNKATFSSELCERLLNIYGTQGGVVYDSFMGTGTTAVAAKRLGMKYIGSEISEKQCEYAENRLKNVYYEPDLF